MDDSSEKIVIPDGTERVEDGVFFGCENLTKVSFPKSVSHIGEWIFSHDDEDTHREGERYKDLYLDTRKTTFLVSKDSYAEKFLRAYQADTYTDQNLTVIYDSAVSDSITFQDKIFVLTGFGTDEEATITKKIQSLGGIVKSSTVVKTDYLIVMEEYNRVTTKYQKAKELQAQGKNLAIISSSAFYAFVKNT